jgi:hypothetical protein
VPLERVADDVPIVVDGGAGPLHGVLKIPAPPVLPILSVQSGLMNPEGDKNCPPGNAEFFALQRPNDVALRRGGMPGVTKIVAPFGQGPICLVFRWLNHTQFQQVSWEFRLTSESPPFQKILRLRDGAPDGESVQVWRSVAFEIPHAALDGLSSELKIGATSYFAQYDEERLAQGKFDEPVICAKGGDCVPLRTDRTNRMSVKEDSLSMFLRLRVTGAPTAMPAWHIPATNGRGSFRIKEVTPDGWILQTDENRSKNIDDVISIFIERTEYILNLDKGWAAWFTKIGKMTYPVLAYLYYLMAVVGVFIAIVAKRLYHGEMRPDEILHAHHHVGVELRSIFDRFRNWISGITIPRDRYRFILSGAGLNLKPFMIPGKWGRPTYIIIDELGSPIVRQRYGKPRGPCLSISIAQGPILKLEAAGGVWTITIVERGRSVLSVDNTYSVKLAELIGESKEIEIAVGAGPKKQTVQLKYLGLESKRSVGPLPVTEMRQ